MKAYNYYIIVMASIALALYFRYIGDETTSSMFIGMVISYFSIILWVNKDEK